MMKKLLFVGMILVLMVSFTSVLADQDGKTCWCNVDNDGCWNTNDEGGKDYIMFWSEEARKFYMGDSTAPYANVVDRAEGATLGLLCGAPKVTAAAAEEELYCLATHDSCITKAELDAFIEQCSTQMHVNCYYDKERNVIVAPDVERPQ